MKIVELTEQDRRAYNDFVMGQEAGSFLQSWEWGQWQEALGRAVYRLKIADEKEGWLGSMQLIKMPLPLGRCYLYAPYGPVTDAGLKIPDLKPVLRELKDKFPKAVFIRLEPKDRTLPSALCPLLAKTSNVQPARTLVLDLSRTGEELLKEMHHKTRYNIRLAQRHGVEVVSDLAVVPGHGLYFEEALGLILETAQRQDYKGYQKQYYQKLLDFFGTKNHHSDLQVFVYRALLKKELLAAAVMVDFGRVRTYLFGGSSDRHREAMAPHLLHFTAILEAKAKGLQGYDFWGLETASGKTAGFVRFKQGFAPQVGLEPLGGGVKEYAGAYDFACQPLGYRAYQGLRLINRLVR